MNIKKTLGGTAAVLALGGMLVFGQPFTLPDANAATAEPAATQTANVYGPGAGLGRVYGNMMDSVSKLLGMEPAEVRTERQSGKSLSQIAESKGVTEDKLVDSIVEQRKSQLDQSVANGTISQEQAEYCEENMEQRVTESVARTTVGPRDGRGGKGMGRAAGIGQSMGRGMGMGRAAGMGAAIGYGQ
ncbi:hypothetical protein [Phosphitispora fastidiosa]|uniref:hypothetical protein n=1 Tax=Phosphitispora fastidiosa TaxID=2837202 RepID=UPI001E5848AF|nr:hypothetical protein [Phosphitispora fastidiosa]MBU7006151.1 hypothetical protein [Phosphitispora fastidiosa]